MDAVLLSRWQFALTIGVHFIFVTLSLGIIWPLLTIETFAWRTQDAAWERAARFFGRVFVITFVFGVVTGLVMEFQFGTNWAGFADFAGDVFGTPLAAEGMFSFFLESVFIGVYIFGRHTLPRGLHWFSCLMVAVGATLSAFWILVANSWMNTPAGYLIEEGRIVLDNFGEVVFTRSIWPRFLHTVAGVVVAGAFFIAGVSAYWLLKRKQEPLARKALRLAVVVAFVTSLAQLYPFGDMSARQVAQTQPAKLATMEALEKTQANAPLVLFGIPVEDPPHLILDVRVPDVLSWLAYRNTHAEITGMDQFTPDDLPPFTLVFTSFHLMVYLGMFFIALGGLCVALLFKGRIFRQKWLLILLVVTIPLPIVACQLGWITTEVGRQPWIIYNVVRTADAVSPNVTAKEVLLSVIAFCTVYTVINVFYGSLVVREIKRGPKPLDEEEKY